MKTIIKTLTATEKSSGNIISTCSYESDDRSDANKLEMLSDIVNDILKDGSPSEEDLDFDFNAILLYDSIVQLSENLKKMGI